MSSSVTVFNHNGRLLNLLKKCEKSYLGVASEPADLHQMLTE